MSESNEIQMQHKAFAADVKVEVGERSVVARISTAAVDRDGEVLIPMGCNSKDFEKNPVVMWLHNYNRIPIGKVVGFKRTDDEVVAKMVLASRPDSYPEDKEWEPDTLLSLYQQGILSAFSVGFIPTESRPATDRDAKKYGDGVRRVHSKWKILEVSAVPLPANQEAVAIAVSKGIISAEFAKSMCGVDTEADAETSANADEVESFTEEAADTAAIEKGLDESPAEPKAAEEHDATPEVKISVPAKRLVYFVAPPPADPAAAVAKAMTEHMQKRRGRIYYV